MLKMKSTAAQYVIVQGVSILDVCCTEFLDNKHIKGVDEPFNIGACKTPCKNILWGLISLHRDVTL